MQRVVDFGSASTFPSANHTSVFESLLNNPSQQLQVKRITLKDPFRFYQALRPHFEHSFILESAPGPQRLAEYTFLGFNPQSVVCLSQERLFLDGVLQDERKNPLDSLREMLRQHQLEAYPQIKYLGGLVGYFGYDFIPHVERVPRPNPPHPFPDAELGLYLDGIVFDHASDQAYYFTHAEDRSEFFLALFERASASETEPFICGAFETSMNEEQFSDAVVQAKEAIRQGEAYQIVLSRQLQASFSGDPLDAYEQMRSLAPSPYMYFIEFGDRTIAGSSPEMLVAVQDRIVSTYPIAGTRSIGNSDEERQRLADDLLNDEKERAEHVMLVDLARNDVGRIAEVGSVNVSQYMQVETFSHVQHLVSCVQGKLDEGFDSLDALTSVFPAGTVSGAPKVRAIELINALEPCARGPYAGVVGYASLNGNLDTAIAIRTAFFTKDQVYLQAGAGIVADSAPEREFLETQHKLDPMRQALTQAIASGGEA